MRDLRGRIRKIPFSTEVYAYSLTRAKMVRSRSKATALLRSGRELRLDLGGGYQPGRNGWVNVDVSPQADLFWDLRYGIPFPDDSVEAVYSSHLLEHLTYEQGQALLAEVKRVLKPGGTISIVVPNARMYIESYLTGNALPEEYFGWVPAYNRTTRIDVVNYIAYMGGEHAYLFDEENLLHILSASGFADVSSRGFDPSTDLEERDYESIYAVGVKP